jgi:quercetin dioxygenase-like cupin family protein
MHMSQALADARIYTPDLAAIRADMEAARAAYHRLLGSLSDADLERPCAISKWTLKELLCHMALLVEQAVPMMVKQARKGKSMPRLLDTRFGHWMNYQMAVRAARKATRESLGRRYDSAHARLLDLLDEVRDGEWSLPTAYPDGVPLTMETVFHVPAEHIALHAGWIRQTLNDRITSSLNQKGEPVMTKKPAMVVAAPEGRTLNVLGHAVTIKLAREETNGDYYIFELVSPPGLGVPPHVHQHEDEVIYVVEGEFEVWIAGEVTRATAGATFHFPRYTPHGFQNVGATAGKTLWSVMPGANFEPFFEDLGALPPGPPDLAKVAAIFGNYQIDLLPPPPAAGL